MSTRFNMEDERRLVRVVKILRKYATPKVDVPFSLVCEDIRDDSEGDEDPPFGATLIDSGNGSFDLWLGSVSDAMYTRALKQKNVFAIINMAAGQCRDIQRIERIAGNGSQWEKVAFAENWYKERLDNQQFEYLAVHAEDHPRYKLVDDLRNCISFLDCLEGKFPRENVRPAVLVHCIQGMNRAAAVCVAYLIRRRSLSLEEAVDHVASRRPGILSNRAFVRQLIGFSQEEGGLAEALDQFCKPVPRKIVSIGDVVERVPGNDPAKNPNI
jgi:protein-tyrosine phosphatase